MSIAMGYQHFVPPGRGAIDGIVGYQHFVPLGRRAIDGMSALAGA
jgi:hypothetical protein